MSDVVKFFFEPENPEESAKVKHITQCDWEQAPHLDAAAKAQLLASTPPYQRDARTKGIPQLGAGAIYPVAESEIVVPYFDRSRLTGRAATAWTSAGTAPRRCWGALDRENGVAYLYHEYSRAQAEPLIHAAGIKALGEWIQGVVDPACLGSSQIDGRTLMEMYGELGLHRVACGSSRRSGTGSASSASITGTRRAASSRRTIT